MALIREGSELTEPFWAAAAEDRLVRPVCDRCSRSFFSPQVLCPWCQSASWSFQTSSGRGSVYSYTIVHRPPSSDFVAPYVVGDVEMDEGWRLFSWIVGCAPDEVRSGMRVGVTFGDHPTMGRAPYFAPVEHT